MKKMVVVFTVFLGYYPVAAQDIVLNKYFTRLANQKPDRYRFS